MAKRFPTESPALYRKFKGADKKQVRLYNSRPEGSFFAPEQTRDEFRRADVQMKGIRQRVFESPRGKAIRQAESRFDEYTFNKSRDPKLRSKYVSQNWKKFL